MSNHILIKNKLNNFKKKIFINSDKSLSIRAILLASQAVGVSKIYNLLESEDVMNSIKAINKLGIKILKKNNFYEIYGYGLNGFKPKNNITINAGNSGTFSRLILSSLVKNETNVKLIGDKSLSKRDFFRVIKPLREFGTKIKSKKNLLPIIVKGTKFLRPIDYVEKIGSAQCKSAVMIAALNTPGITKIKAKKSRNHTELFFKYLKIPITLKKEKKFDIIKIRGLRQYNAFNYEIPGDISSASFFIALTVLSASSELIIKNVNINNTRLGVFKILKMMNANIKILNKKKYKGELIGDIFVKSSKNLKSIKCPVEFNTTAIDEFLIIFLIASKAKGISIFKNLQELKKKESDRLKIGSNILKLIGVKNQITNGKNIKIWGNQNLKLNGNYEIKDYMKDHRVMAMTTIAALTLGGTWKIHDKNSINTSFPDFIKILKNLGAKIAD